MPASETITLGLIQHACPGHASKQDNLETTCEMIRQAADRGAQLIATQELFTTAYFPQAEDESRFDLAETIPGPTTHHLAELAQQLNVEITASLFEKRSAGVYHNTSILIDAGGQLVGKYRKMHVPDDPHFYEKYYFTPGDLDFQSHPTRHANAGMLVCWDQWFPEAARLTALRGAEVLLYPTAIGWHEAETAENRAAQKDAWQTIQRSHAIANGVFVAAINRVGVEGELSFWGSSFVADPAGRIIAEASATEPEVLVVECDLKRIEQLRRGWPFLRDRRIDAYGPLTRRLVD